MLISSEHYTIKDQLVGSKESLRILLVHIGLYSILFCHQLLIAVWHPRDNYLPSAPLFPNPFLLKESCLLNTSQHALPAFHSLHVLSAQVLKVKSWSGATLKGKMPPDNFQEIFFIQRSMNEKFRRYNCCHKFSHVHKSSQRPVV